MCVYIGEFLHKLSTAGKKCYTRCLSQVYARNLLTFISLCMYVCMYMHVYVYEFVVSMLNDSFIAVLYYIVVSLTAILNSNTLIILYTHYIQCIFVSTVAYVKINKKFFEIMK